VSHLLRALETFRAQGIEFVSFSEQLETSRPTGKMVFTVLGACAELERSLIVERVRAGLRNARAKGKKLGRPSETWIRRAFMGSESKDFPGRKSLKKWKWAWELYRLVQASRTGASEL
jgi:DNA invertase Pin-like site-specific DNA recombinase